MKWIAIMTAAVFVLFGMMPPVSRAIDHNVEIIVLKNNSIAVTGGDIVLTITSFATPAVNNTSCDLVWNTNAANRKITVESNLPTPTYTLTVEAINVSSTGGSPAGTGVVALDTTVRDFITGVGKSSGSCDLEYSASATPAQPIGSETHTVTYTMING